MKQKWKILLTGLLALCVLGQGMSVAAAQSLRSIQWRYPVELTETNSYSTSPQVVIDPENTSHFFWIEDLGGLNYDALAIKPSTGNAIMHRTFSAQMGLGPIVDVVYSNSNNISSLLSVIGEDGSIYIFWKTIDAIYYSRAFYQDAGNAQLWSPAVRVSNAVGGAMSATVDDKGGIHVVFSRFLDEGGKKDGNIYYTYSADGQSFSLIEQISDISVSDNSLVDRPQLAIDDWGGLHLVWYTINPPDWLGTSVLYSRSLDNGKTWTTVKVDGQLSSVHRWASKPLIVVDHMEVHLMWACGQLPYRCHQISYDRGTHWSSLQEKVFGDLHSLAYWDAVAMDDAGQICWLLQLRYPEAVYYSCWIDGQWRDPQIVVDVAPLNQMHGLTASMKGGRIVLLGVFPPQGSTIWFIDGEYEADQSVDAPTQRSFLSPTATETEEASDVLPVATPGAFQDSVSTIKAISLQPIGVYVGVGLSVLMIGLVLILKRLGMHNG